MPLVITEGGGAAQFGAGLGAGLLNGVDRGRQEDENRKQATAMNQVTTAAWRAVIEAEKRGQGFSGETQFNPPGQVVEPSNPGSLEGGVSFVDPDEAEFQALVRSHDTAMEAIQDPEQRRAYFEVAKGDLENLHGMLNKNKVGAEIQNAIASGLIPPEQGQEALTRLEGEADPKAAREAWEKFKEEKRGQVRRTQATKQTLDEVGGWLAKSEKTASESTDPDEVLHADRVKRGIQSVLGEVALEMQVDGDKFNPTPYYARAQAIYNQPNAYQAKRIAEARAEAEAQFKQALIEQQKQHDFTRAKELEHFKAQHASLASQLKALRTDLAAAMPSKREGIQGQIDAVTDQLAALKIDDADTAPVAPTQKTPKATTQKGPRLVSQVRSAVMEQIGAVKQDQFPTSEDAMQAALEVGKATLSAYGVSTLDELRAKDSTAASHLDALYNAIRERFPDPGTRTLQEQNQPSLPLIQ